MKSSPEHLPEPLSRILKPLHLFIPVSLDADEKRKRILVVAGALFAIPVLFYFTLTDIRQDETIGIVLDLGLAILLTVSLCFIGRMEKAVWLYRVMLAGFLGLLLYNMMIGPSGQSSLVWMI